MLRKPLSAFWLHSALLDQRQCVALFRVGCGDDSGALRAVRRQGARQVLRPLDESSCIRVVKRCAQADAEG